MAGTRVPPADREKVRRLRLRDAAVAATQRGWPVVPGAYAGAGVPTGDLRPEWQNWRNCAITDPQRAHQVWDEAMRAVLLVCGRGVDALEVPWSVCELLGALAGANMPVPVLPVSEVVTSPRWVLFAATGTGQLYAELAAAGVRLLGENCWMALPPTRIGLVHMRWTVEPPEGGGCVLPTTDAVQELLVTARNERPADVGVDG